MKKIQYDQKSAFAFFSRLTQSGLKSFCSFSVLVLGLLISSNAWGQTTLFRSAQTGDWNNVATWEISTDGGASWAPAGFTPTQSNSDEINILAAHIVTVTASETVDQLTIAAGGQLNVDLNQTLTIGNGAGTDLTVDGIINNSGTVNRSGAATAVVNGLLINSNSFNISGGSASLTFSETGVYEHRMNGGLIPIATWNSGSPGATCFITGTVDDNPGRTNQAFYNIIWNVTGLTSNINFGSSGAGMSVGGDFAIASTGTGRIHLNQDALVISGNYVQRAGNIRIGAGGINRTVTVGGDFLVIDGTFLLNAGTGTSTLEVAGDFTHTGGIIEETGAGQGVIVFNGTSPQIYTGGGTVNNNINYTIIAGATLAPVDGTALGGASSTIENLGTIAPGSSPGTLIIGGDLTSTGTLSMEINGTGATDFDQIFVTGTATINGTLEADFGVFEPMMGDVFPLINAGSYAGSPTLSVITPHVINATYDASNGELTVNSIFPIQLVFFTGERKDDAIELNWRTESEENNHYMAVERAADGFTFREIGRVTGAGTTRETQDYSFMDEKPLPGVNYYRLRQVDLDGRTEYHPVVAIDFVNVSRSAKLEVFPNPTSESLRINWKAGRKEAAILQVFSSTGQLLSTHRTGGENGTFELPLQHLPAGTYILELMQGNKREVIRFLKK